MSLAERCGAVFDLTGIAVLGLLNDRACANELHTLQDCALEFSVNIILPQ